MTKQIPAAVFTRDDPLAQRDMIVRTIQVRSATINEEERSIEAVLASETPAFVFDMRSYEVIQEVLIVRGAELPTQLPLLATHDRWSLDSVLGSWRNLRMEGDQIIGRMFFVRGDPAADSAWNKVRQGHLTDVSVGYTVKNSVDIPPGQTQNVGGRSFTANARTLRVSTEWTPKEGSLVPIGADPSAKTRKWGNVSPSKKEIHVNPQLRAYLVSLGMRADATDQEANDYLAKLGTAERAAAEALESLAATPPAAPAPAAPPAEPQRAAPGAAPATPDLDAIRSAAAVAERQRISRLTELAGSDVPRATLDRAIAEGMDENRASGLFLTAVRDARQVPPPEGARERAPAGQVRSPADNRTRETIALAIFQRGVTGDAQIQAAARRMGIRENWEEIAHRADEFRDLSMLDICREAIQLDGREVPRGRDAIIERAMSGGSLANIFTTSTHARVMMGWDEVGDTTIGWVEEVENPDFKKQEEIDFTANTALARHPRGGKATDATVEDVKEEWKIARYSKKFTVDEQDVIDDNFSVLMTVPVEMGKAARRLRPDLVYAILLANPTLARDNKRLFVASGHANYGTSGTAFAAATLQAGMTAMRKQARNGKTLDINPKFLLVPADLAFDASVLIRSTERVIASASGGTYNPLQGLLTVVSDNRLGVAGVTDPATGTAYAGTATQWFLDAAPGRTIKVGYLRGTGRGPQIRSYTLDKGEWGLGWDIKMDIGAAPVDYAGLYMATGGA